VLPNQIFHHVSESYFGGQSFGSHDMINVLPGGQRHSEGISRFSCEQKLECLQVEVLLIVFWLPIVLHPAFCIKMGSHYVIETKHFVNFLFVVKLVRFAIFSQLFVGLV
jgi:hypothetical protein